MKPNIALVGMMGAGKTTIGRLLSQALNMGFFDIDAEIEHEQNMTIAKIFEFFGEEYFRALEHEMCKKIPQMSGMIISTGGGIVLNTENIALLRQSCAIIYLSATAETLRSRIEASSSLRPLLIEDSSSVGQILEARWDKYEAATDHTIITNGKKEDEICAEIIDFIGGWADFGRLQGR